MSRPLTDSPHLFKAPIVKSINAVELTCTSYDDHIIDEHKALS